MDDCTILVDGEAFPRSEWLDSIEEADPAAHARVKAMRPGQTITMSMFGLVTIYRLTEAEEAQEHADFEALVAEQTSNYYNGLGLR